MSGPLLNITNVSKHFGGISALNNVSFTIEPGRIQGLIGPNGAGKTTLFNLITGVHRLSGGSITFENHTLSTLPTYAIARLGITRTFQNVRLFPNLTVLENVMVGSHQRLKAGFITAALNLPPMVREETECRNQAKGLIEFVGLEKYTDRPADALVFGQQRLLEIARALAAKPKLLLLDEPAAGLSAPERTALVKLIKEIRAMGITILLVEHDMDMVMKVCENIVVLEFGSKIAEGDPDTIQNNPQVIAAYLGEEV
ncbi:MAG TPA: ABC transporter ATP-binding protein [Bacillota bacterium]|nr:ABC transporter ATP-binding protein [Bacillota bacterium]